MPKLSFELSIWCMSKPRLEIRIKINFYNNRNINNKMEQFFCLYNSVILLFRRNYFYKLPFFQFLFMEIFI